MKKILIFGVGGFVGAYLTGELVSAGYEVYGSDISPKSNLEKLAGYYSCDLTSADSVKDVITGCEPDGVVNLAAISSVGLSWKMPQTTVSVNVIGTLNILEALKEHNPGATVLLIGSSEEYLPSDEPISEDWPTAANNPYGISKATVETFADIYSSKYDMDIRFARAFNHTGVGQKDNFVIPSWCKQAAEISASGKPGTMKVGNLAVKRDLSDVRDIVRAYRMILESDSKCCMYNVGSGKAYALGELLDYIVSLSENEIEVVVDEALLRPADNPVICADCSLIRDELGWESEHSIFEAIDGLFSFYLNQ